MSSLLEDIISLKGLADNLCTANDCSLKGALGKHCKSLRGTLEGLIKSKELCVDDVVTQVSGQISVINQAVEKDPSTNTFSLSVLNQKYMQWLKDIRANLIAVSDLGKNAKPKTSNDTFATLAGAESEKAALTNGLILPFQYPGLFPNRVRGCLLYGSPGTGKSKLAAALVSELNNAFFFAPDAGSLKGKYEGETEARITAVYTNATAFLNAPPAVVNGVKQPKKEFAVIFLDEVDALLGKGREDDASKQRTVNTLLTMIDGLNSDPRITTIGATNYPQAIDTAALRRLTLQIFVDLPTKAARRQAINDLLSARYKLPGSPLTAIELIAEYGARDSRGGGYITRQSHALLSLSEAQLEELVEMTGPGEAAAKYMSVLPGKFSRKAIREIGFSLSEISGALSLAFNTAAERAVTEESCYTKVSCNYVYNPNATPQERKNLSANQDIRDKHGSRILNFDIRLSDISRQLDLAPKSVTVEEYKTLIAWKKQGDVAK